MIVGIGNDIVEINRFESIVERKSVLYKMFSEREVILGGKRPSFFAGSFAVKESVSKAFGTGIRGFRLNEIEVLRDELGKPYVELWGRAKELAEILGIDSIYVSISDTKQLVAAVAVAEAKESRDGNGGK
ncbi:MAG: holo-ACP synthase [Lachnospiraceae bacterium]|nr:holo-ACP synthase [Lachnospiraceae bacterium]